jgi:hypothetical protein
LYVCREVVLIKSQVGRGVSYLGNPIKMRLSNDVWI